MHLASVPGFLWLCWEVNSNSELIILCFWNEWYTHYCFDFWVHYTNVVDSHMTHFIQNLDIQSAIWLKSDNLQSFWEDSGFWLAYNFLLNLHHSSHSHLAKMERFLRVRNLIMTCLYCEHGTVQTQKFDGGDICFLF